MKTFKQIFLGMVLSLLVMFIFYLLFTLLTGNIVKTQMDAIRKGDLNKAYSYTSKNYQTDVSFEKFKKFIQSYSPLYYNKSLRIYDKKTEGDLQIIMAELKSKDGSNMKIGYKLIKQGTDWKIEYMGFDFDFGQERRDVTNENTQSSLPTPKPGPKIDNIFVSDSVSTNGNVEMSKTYIDKTSSKIYATVQITEAKENSTITAELTHSQTGTENTPIKNNVDKAGKIISNFSFTSTGGGWLNGEYIMRITLSTGDIKEISFMVK
jgi:hypothetical protein